MMLRNRFYHKIRSIAYVRHRAKNTELIEIAYKIDSLIPATNPFWPIVISPLASECNVTAVGVLSRKLLSAPDE